MIRYVVGLFVFAVVLCAYIVNLPRDDGRRAAAPAPQPTEVTRAGTAENLALLSADASDVTVAPELPFATTSDPLGITITNILLGLGLPAETLGPSAARARGPESGIELIVLQALQARMADAEIATRINDAAVNRNLLVPDVLVRTDATIDSQTLLDAIITRAGHAAGDAVSPTPVLGDIPSLTWVGDQAFHTVEAGESLAALAARYLGDATRTDVLLVANASTLPRADLIAVGQRLLIPSR